MTEQELFTKIAGVTFNQCQEVIKTLNVGEKLGMVREPENPYDCNAIGLTTQKGLAVGHIKAVLAEELAPAMDKGILYSCEVQEITGGQEKNLGVNIKITRMN